ncbi:MAG: hypothetical protein BRC22_01210 [Parcubacteria group bacterium QH_9_35_7]|nr:MAG: hypothetical protein BRC22_01210 [Parcubacteria group bacterium QH_9_35_7]
MLVSVKLTIAKWHTPSGDVIHEQGIEPNKVLEKMAKEIKNEEGEVTDVKDLALEQAIKILKEKIKKKE